MVIVGVDAHKRSHTCVAVDATGRKLGEKIVEATVLATRRPSSGRCSNSDLNSPGQSKTECFPRQRAVRVPTKMMARARVSRVVFGR